VLLPKDYARLWLTGEHVSEMSDAAGTGWLDVANRKWSDELLGATQLTTENMPSLVEGTAASGTIRHELSRRFGLRESVVVAGGAGDNAASACGMGTVKPGDAFLSLGTSGVLFAANASYQPNAQSAVHTFCHALPDTWHQMGVILAATDSLNWLAKERTPHNDANVRGVFLGLSHDTDTIQMTRAVLQGVAFAFRDSQNALASAGTELDSAYAIGGGSKSGYWLQLIASALKLPLHTTADGDYGAGLGAARLGMIAAESADPEQVCQKPPVSQTIEPKNELFDHYSHEFNRYQQAYKSITSLPKAK